MGLCVKHTCALTHTFVSPNQRTGQKLPADIFVESTSWKFMDPNIYPIHCSCLTSWESYLTFLSLSLPICKKEYQFHCMVKSIKSVN